jgi:hypothetical protein
LFWVKVRNIFAYDPQLPVYDSPVLIGGVALMARTCCVSFYWNGGEYSNTVMGESVFDVAAQALEFFCGPNWKGLYCAAA